LRLPYKCLRNPQSLLGADDGSALEQAESSVAQRHGAPATTCGRSRRGCRGVLAAATTPLANALAAHADGFDLILGPIINSIAGSLTGLVDPLTGLDTVSGVDPVAGLALPTADLAASSTNLGASAADSALASASDPTPAVSSFDSMLQTLAQEWINSSYGAATTISSTRCGTTLAAAAF
jgi:hypothetical protein